MKGKLSLLAGVAVFSRGLKQQKVNIAGFLAHGVAPCHTLGGFHLFSRFSGSVHTVKQFSTLAGNLGTAQKWLILGTNAILCDRWSCPVRRLLWGRNITLST